MELRPSRDPVHSIENFFKSLFHPMRTQAGAGQYGGVPRPILVDVVDADQEYVVRADLPGVHKEDVSVSIEGSRVVMAAECRDEKDASDGSERMLSRERHLGSLRRTLQLADEIDEGKARAVFADGVLELHLPRKKSAGSKRLPIS